MTVQDGDGERETIPTRTVIWAAGVLASALAQRLGELSGADVDRVGRLAVEPDLSLPGHPEVLALGDMVRVRQPDGSIRTLPGVAPVAMQRAATPRADPRPRWPAGEPSRSRTTTRATWRRSAAAARSPSFPACGSAGFPAWMVWLVVHLWYLIGFQNRLLVLIRWVDQLRHARARRAADHGRRARLHPHGVTAGGPRAD